MSSKTINISFILLYISIWLSLDSSAYNLVEIKNENFFNLVIALRFIFPYVLFIVLAVLLKKNLLFIKCEGIFKYIIYLIFFSFSLQVITPFFNENSLLNISFPLTSIILLVTLIFFYNNFDFKIIFLISLTILFFITFLYGSGLIYHLFFETKNLHLYGSWPHNLNVLHFLSNEVPRSSGISRSSLILMIPLGLFFLLSKKYNYKFYFIFLFFSFLMLSTQSRLTFIGYILGTIAFIYYIFFVFKNRKFTEKIKIFSLIIILPIFFWLVTLELLSLTRSTPAYLEYIADKFNYKISKKDSSELQEKYEKLIRRSDQTSFTSRRYEDWTKIIENNNNHFLGYGAQGDRFLINQSASSLYFFNYASGGLLTVFIFLLLVFRSTFLSIITIFKLHSIPDKNNYLVLSAAFIVLFLIIRSLVESSFAVFGIDSLMFFSGYFYLEQTYKKKG